MGLSLGQPLSYASSALALTGGGGALYFEVANLPVWSAAVRGVQAGTADADVLLWGDSLTAGTGSEGDGANGLRAHSFGAEIARLLNLHGVPAIHSSLNASNGRSIAQYLAYNPTVSFSATTGWITNGTSLGGPLFSGTVVGERMTWSPLEEQDGFECVFNIQASSGVMGVYIDNALVDSVNLVGPAALIKKTYTTASVGIHTIGFAKLSGSGAVNLSTVIQRNSARKRVNVMNAGWGGANAANLSLNSATTHPVQVATLLAPKLTLICSTMNDFAAPTVQASYEASHQRMIDTAQLSGDVIAFMSNSRNLVANEATIFAYLQSVAAAQGIALGDWRTAVGTYTQAQASGDGTPGDIHLTKQGYDKVGLLKYNLITPAAYQ
ncbi:hypothetical protein MMB232_01227 [Brevundimonas subvibrioides]|uniref:SGNH/GDSL hydrolase family protein n=1 Tax=Brevundimonas subvibrioides TaxID=74313 RepID=UPI0032D58BD4